MTQIHKVEMLGSGVVKAAPEKPPKVAEVHEHTAKRNTNVRFICVQVCSDFSYELGNRSSSRVL